MMISDDFLDTINVDTALLDVVDNEFSNPLLKVMALLSVGTIPHEAYDGATELADAVNLLVHNEGAAKHRIAEILGRQGCDYQRALFYTLAGRGIYRNSAQLNRLVQLLKARREMWTSLQEAGREVNILGPVYVAPEGEGPRGTFSPDFDLSGLDQSWIDSWRQAEAEDRSE